MEGVIVVEDAVRVSGTIDRMDFQRICLWAALASLLFFSNYGGVRAGDIVHDDNLAPKKPGCENDFVLVIFFSLFRFEFPAYFNAVSLCILWVYSLGI